MTQDNPKQEFSPEQRFQIGPQNSQGSPEQVKQFAKQAPEVEREFVTVDLQTTRPYFLIPFLDQDDIRVDDPSAPVPVAALDLVRATKRLKEYLAKSGPITDVYVVSHGWHRNLYSATAAYDRIISRFATLRRRGRIKTGEPFNPLFLTLHWHSDLGENGWVDHLGRRDRDSFLRLVFERLKPRKDGISSGTMRNTFEDLFELFVKMSSPNIGALAPGIQDDARDFSSTFTEYTIRDAEDATPDEVIAAAWSCYHEAEVAKPVVEQQERPRPFSSVSSYLTKMVQIVVGVAGIGTVLGLVFKSQMLADIWEWVRDKAETAASIIPGYQNWNTEAKLMLWSGLVYLLLWLVVVVGIKRVKVLSESYPTRFRSTLGPLSMAAWLILQVVHSIPILLYCLLSPILSAPVVALAMSAVFGALLYFYRHPWYIAGIIIPITFLVYRSSLYSEKGDGDSTWWQRVGLFARKALVKIARYPIRTVQSVTDRDSRSMQLWQAVDNQLAFWDMVEKAVESAHRAGEWLFDRIDEVPTGEDGKPVIGPETRVHLFGHSHGGLLVMNLARCIAANRKPEHPKLQTVATVNGAFMSAWLEGEKKLIESVQGCIAAVYSRYDVANSFWYPMANSGRRSAGYVGLYFPTQPEVLATPLPYAFLSTTPNLVQRIAKYEPAKVPKQIKIVNIDGSRLVFDGPIIPQGSHNDIFKDEVVQLLWATTQFERDRG
jgi:hypothetical protein